MTNVKVGSAGMRTRLTSVAAIMLGLTIAAPSANAAALYDVQGEEVPDTTPSGGDPFTSASLSGFLEIGESNGQTILSDYSLTFKGESNGNTVDIEFNFPGGGNKEVMVTSTGDQNTNVSEYLVSSEEGDTLIFAYPGLTTTGLDQSGDPITVDIASFSGFPPQFRVDNDGDTVASTELMGTVTFNPGETADVPAPGALPMLATALALLGFVGWRRRIAGN